MKEHDYAAALNAMTRGDVSKEAQRHFDTLIHALRFAEKMMQSPDTAMLSAGSDAWHEDPFKRSSTLFNAMRDAALKELGE